MKRVFLLVAAIEIVLAVGLYAYYNFYENDFFPYDINADGSITVTGAPLLIGYGETLSSPWTFTAVGSDTLMLNGLPFLPVRAKDLSEDMPAEARDRIQTAKLILAEAEEAYLATDTKAEGIEAFGATLESYLGTFVYSVITDRHGEQVIVDFVDDLPSFTITFKREPHWVEPEGQRKKMHYDMIESFIAWMDINDADAVFSFGPYHTNLTVGNHTRQDYTSVLSKLDELANAPRHDLSDDRVRKTLGDADYDRWHDLIQDYVNWRGLFETNAN